jgi:hypothetical protein
MSFIISDIMSKSRQDLELIETEGFNIEYCRTETNSFTGGEGN